MPHHSLENARLLRRRATEAEAILWDALRSRRLGGYKFRRQHSLAAFIVDFYCPSVRLVVEVDGGIHRARPSPAGARLHAGQYLETPPATSCSSVRATASCGYRINKS